MQLKEFGVCLGDLIQEFNFEVIYGPDGFEKVEITKDQKYAKIYVSVFGQEEEGRKASVEVLNSASGFIARELNSRVRMRRIPALHFVLDTSIEYSVHISQMLREIMPQEDAQEGSDDGDVQ